MTWVGFLQSVGGLKRKHWGSQKRKGFCLQIAFELETAKLTSAGIPSLQACPAGFTLASSLQ